MSTEAYVRSRQGEAPKLDGKGLSIGIAVAEWNSNITEALLEGAIATLRRASVDQIEVMHVPGTFELTNASARLRLKGYDAVIAIGCVVRGDTPHFDYICQGVSVGISMLNATPLPSSREEISPVIFCVLTTNNMAQAEERAGGALGNKGEEAAEAAIKMCRPSCTVQK
ncbi:6,7-dimethyl-8-ribityllumazine synthase [Porphyromonas sp. COT-239 OH1446]|uniref:6,7-dimethyl-8-ribityllumazine synthase n=1 Tax=Porphyromonas sp. COT-239 OH1446 TaxID=1515613 RepID=UPI00052BCEB2|nr:6,7-dimethyl-8-ribityllumazine synthase [Porphyromonas sp. COT-239 OH1446]KGN68057.1 6,7-dimethyl-8-ribityllumazine synthase [Porphyromonas sp. COT-239 OH1446]